jgi:hypothetical protein
MSKLTADAGIDKITDDADKWRFISTFFAELKQLINNGLQFADNFNGKTLTLTFSASATDTALTHGLGRVPTGYIILKRSASMTVYDGSAAWTSQLMYLRASATGSVTVLVF